MSGHTPGPWKRNGARRNGDGWWHAAVFDAKGTTVAIAYGRSRTEAAANAEVITVALELGAALAELRAACADAYKAGRIPAEPFVRAGIVIAKATA